MRSKTVMSCFFISAVKGPLVEAVAAPFPVSFPVSFAVCCAARHTLWFVFRPVFSSIFMAYFSISVAARAPSPVAVTTCLSGLMQTSPAA